MNKIIKIRGARVNNLKNIDLDLPINKLICFSGPSGSGKSSIAFHTLYTESKRRFLNSFPTYLKFFSDRPAPVDVDIIEPVLPVFGLPQINPVVGTRSTVSDIMHATELLQNVYFHHSKELCPDHLEEFQKYLFTDSLKESVTNLIDDEVYYLFIKAEEFVEFFSNRPFPSRSFKSRRTRKVSDFDKEHEFWEVLRFKGKGLDKVDAKVKEYLEKGLTLTLFSESLKKLVDIKYRAGEYQCPADSCQNKKTRNLSMMHFSPYNALGACSECGGFGENLDYDEQKLVDRNKTIAEGGVSFLNYKRFAGQLDNLLSAVKKEKISTKTKIDDLDDKFWTILYEGSGDFPGLNAFFKYLEKRRYKMNVRIFLRNIQKEVPCTNCYGTRLNTHVKQFFIEKNEKSLDEIMNMNVGESLNYLGEFSKSIKANKEFKKSLTKLISILKTAESIGLGHLNLLRKAKTISAGEYQRLLLLKYLSYEGTGALFVFDEPSLGLSLKECKALYKSFEKVLEQKNTIIIVEHNEFFKKGSDYLVEIGPGSGHEGGEVLYAGETKKYKFPKSNIKLTPNKITLSKREWIKVSSPKIHAKTFSDFKLPFGEVIHVNGGSGSGKTACLVNVMGNELTYRTSGKYLNIKRGELGDLNYPETLSETIIVDANLNRYTSRSTVGSMTDLFKVIRRHFLSTPMAKSMGLKDGHFSYNSDLGQCPKCEGKGAVTVEMQFLEDIVLTCEDCNGKRLKGIYADISDGRMTVHEAYSKPILEVLEHVKLTPKYQRIFEQIKKLNLGYLSLNRLITTLSGGEKQRIYLLNKLQKNIENAVIIFENISFGLSERELIQMCEFLQALSLKNNTIIVIDQHLIFKEVASYKLNFDQL